MTSLPVLVGSALGYSAPSGGSSSAVFAKASLPTLQVGDVLVAHIHHRASTAGTWVVPAGWVNDLVNSTSHQWGVWHYVIVDAAALAALPTSWTFTSNQAVSRMAGAMYVRRGVNPNNPVNVISAPGAQGGASTAPFSALTTAKNNCVVDYFAAAVQQTTNAGVNIVPDASTTEVYEIVGGVPATGASDNLEMATVNQLFAGVIAAKTATSSGTPNFTNMGGGAIAWEPVPDGNTAPVVTSPDPLTNVEPGDVLTLTFAEADADANINTASRVFRIISAVGVTETVVWSRSGNVVTLTAPNSLDGATINYGYTVSDTLGAVSTEATGSISVLGNTRRIKMADGSFRPITRRVSQ